MEGLLKCSLTGANGGDEVIINGHRRKGAPGQYFLIPEVVQGKPHTVKPEVWVRFGSGGPGTDPFCRGEIM